MICYITNTLILYNLMFHNVYLEFNKIIIWKGLTGGVPFRKE